MSVFDLIQAMALNSHRNQHNLYNLLIVAKHLYISTCCASVPDFEQSPEPEYPI